MKHFGGHNLATVSGFGAILLWSSTIACVRRLSEDVGPITAGAAVYSISTLIAGAALLRNPERRRALAQLPGKYLVWCSALFAGYTLLLYLAIGHAHSRDQVLEVGLMNYLWPSLTLLLSLVILGAVANWVLIPGTILALAGVFLVMTNSAHISWGHSRTMPPPTRSSSCSPRVQPFAGPSIPTSPANGPAAARAVPSASFSPSPPCSSLPSAAL